MKETHLIRSWEPYQASTCRSFGTWARCLHQGTEGNFHRCIFGRWQLCRASTRHFQSCNRIQLCIRQRSVAQGILLLAKLSFTVLLCSKGEKKNIFNKKVYKITYVYNGKISIKKLKSFLNTRQVFTCDFFFITS